MNHSWVAVTVLSVLACQSREQPQPALTVEIIGTKAAFDQFQVSVHPLVGDDKLAFATRFLVKRFTLTAPLDVAAQTRLTLASWRNGQEVDRQTWIPFVCINYPSYAEKLVDGWTGRETLQASLEDDGTISLHAEFERPLHRSCEWTPPDSRSGEGAGTQNPTITSCLEPDRMNTTLQITDLSDPSQPVAFTSTLCQSIHYRPIAPDPVFDGAIVNQIVARRPDGAPVFMSLSHCWKLSDTFPVAVFPGVPASVPCDTFVLSVGVDSLSIPASSGVWTLHNGPELPGGGHQMSDVDLVFGDRENGGPAFAAKGHIDLPILKTLAARLR